MRRSEGVVSGGLWGFGGGMGIVFGRESIRWDAFWCGAFPGAWYWRGWAIVLALDLVCGFGIWGIISIDCLCYVYMHICWLG